MLLRSGHAPRQIRTEIGNSTTYLKILECSINLTKLRSAHRKWVKEFNCYAVFKTFLFIENELSYRELNHIIRIHKAIKLEYF